MKIFQTIFCLYYDLYSAKLVLCVKRGITVVISNFLQLSLAAQIAKGTKLGRATSVMAVVVFLPLLEVMLLKFASKF